MIQSLSSPASLWLLCILFVKCEKPQFCTRGAKSVPSARGCGAFCRLNRIQITCRGDRWTCWTVPVESARAHLDNVKGGAAGTRVGARTREEKWELESVPGNLVPPCQCATVGCNIWQRLTFHSGPTSTHAPWAAWAAPASPSSAPSSLSPMYPLETLCMDISERAQSAESKGRWGHSGMAMCSEYLSNHPASWFWKQAECWAAFNIPPAF